jgi:hypothetical protein
MLRRWSSAFNNNSHNSDDDPLFFDFLCSSTSSRLPTHREVDEEEGNGSDNTLLEGIERKFADRCVSPVERMSSPVSDSSADTPEPASPLLFDYSSLDRDLPFAPDWSTDSDQYDGDQRDSGRDDGGGYVRQPQHQQQRQPSFFSPWMCVYDLDAPLCGTLSDVTTTSPTAGNDHAKDDKRRSPPSHLSSSPTSSLPEPPIWTDMFGLLPFCAPSAVMAVVQEESMDVADESDDDDELADLPDSRRIAAKYTTRCGSSSTPSRTPLATVLKAPIPTYPPTATTLRQTGHYFTDFANEQNIEAIYIPSHPCSTLPLLVCFA